MRHILPCGFYKIRYFGIMAQCNTHTKLTQCFELIENQAFLPALEGLPAIEVWRNITGKDPLICTHCKEGMMRPVASWPEKIIKPG